MDASEVIAERKLLFIAPDGSEIVSAVQFCRPYFDDSRGFLCDMEIPGIEKRRWGAGVDGVQAILLAMSLAAALLDARVEKGWKLMWPDTRDETSAKEIFGGLRL
jgi:Domain of unknown function (DUF6968)